MSYLDILDTAFGVLSGIFSAFFFYRILNNIFTVKKQKFFKILAFFILFYSCGMVVFPEEITGCIGIFLLLFLCFFLFFEGKKIEIFSAVILFSPILICIQFFTQDIGRLIWILNGKNLSSLASTLLHSSTLALRIPIWGGIYYFTKKWLKKAHSLTTSMWLIIDLLSLTSFISVVMLLNYIPDMKSYFAYPLSFTCIMTGIACIYMTSYAVDKIRAESQIQNLEYQQIYYEELEKNQQQIRKLRHDMRNHLNTISLLLKQEEYQQATEYLSNLAGETTSELRSFCSNRIVNAILNAKYLLATEKQISCSFQIDIDSLKKIDDISLCSLFSNALDNAIEASSKIPDISKRFIELKARYDKGIFSFQITNSKQNKISTEKGRFLTNKKEKSLHGFGIQNIQDIVQKYNGNLDISYTEKEFCITIFIS